jgi:oxygen-independent coproporphyrinogen III oxidase
MAGSGYDGYAYAYPHKTAYRPLTPAIPLRQAWAHEDKQHLFFYVHLPFCEMRCGFCNLFTTVRPGEGLVARTLTSIQRQSEVVAAAIEPQGIAQAAFGGGTPSFLSASQLDELFQTLGQHWPVSWPAIPVSFEVSPGTVTPEKLAVLRSVGVDRISLGVQSFVPEDLIALKRPQPAGELEQARTMIRAAGFPVFNVDLIYGNQGQDAARWQASLDQAMRWRPEELYLYPLYVGKLTNLDRSGRRAGEHRRDLYRQARDFLGRAGYRQISMRLFRRTEVVRATDYCCQDDGMVGLGPGARSYTRTLHYSTEYAVGQPGVNAIIAAFNHRPPGDHARAFYGTVLDQREQRTRYLIKLLLRVDGIESDAYAARFGTNLNSDFPQLSELIESDLAREKQNRLQLTEEGLAWSDTIGPWLYSAAVAAQMNAYELA